MRNKQSLKELEISALELSERISKMKNEELPRASSERSQREVRSRILALEKRLVGILGTAKIYGRNKTIYRVEVQTPDFTGVIYYTDVDESEIRNLVKRDIKEFIVAPEYLKIHITTIESGRLLDYEI